jgi:hypothetical protein
MQHTVLLEKYPPSQPCACEVCLAYCRRPGWWTVEQALLVLHEGYAGRIMLEISPERTFCRPLAGFQKLRGRFCPAIGCRKGLQFSPAGQKL